jgi:hypothetical protein
VILEVSRLFRAARGACCGVEIEDCLLAFEFLRSEALTVLVKQFNGWSHIANLKSEFIV